MLYKQGLQGDVEASTDHGRGGVALSSSLPDRYFALGLTRLGNSPSLFHHSFSGMLKVSPTHPLKTSRGSQRRSEGALIIETGLQGDRQMLTTTTD